MSKAVWKGSGLLRMLCAFALLSLAFAHKPPHVMAAVYQTAQLQLPDGTYADICLNDTATKHPSMSQFCEACALSSATVLPAPPSESWLVTRFASLDNAAVSKVEQISVSSIERPRSRAPPSFS